MTTSNTYDRVSIEELNPSGWEDFTDYLMEGRPVVTSPGGCDTLPSRDTLPCPPPDFDDFPF